MSDCFVTLRNFGRPTRMVNPIANYNDECCQITKKRSYSLIRGREHRCESCEAKNDRQRNWRMQGGATVTSHTPRPRRTLDPLVPQE